MPFQTTHWSIVIDAQRSGDDGRAAMDTIYRHYRAPLLAYVQHRGYSAADAEDLLHGFFAQVIEQRYLDVADAAKGRFRTFLITCLKHYIANEGAKQHAVKRGGQHTRILPVGEHDPIDALATQDAAPDADFDRRWALTIIERALTEHEAAEREAGNGALFDAVRDVLVTPYGDIDYAGLAARFDTSAGALKVAVHRMRKRLRQHILDEVRLTVKSSREVEDELKILLNAVSGP